MHRALELAELGRGHVSPNPMVGCVIVHQGKVIGEGFHEIYGGPHAEPNAINQVDDFDLLKTSTVYVTLEPCAHWGKTPPCADLLIKHQVQRVVIGAIDSNPLVGGKSIQRMKDAGIEVLNGVLEKEVREQNKRFFTTMEKERPYIVLKWAQTSDGYIARKNNDSKWISNVYSRQLVHQWRAEEDAILVGKNTVLFDNPSLNVRDWSGKDPVRVILASSLDWQHPFQVLDRSIPTIIFNRDIQKDDGNLSLVKIEDNKNLTHILQILQQRKISSVLVEGGSEVLQAFISHNLWDEARVFSSTCTFGDGIPAPKISGTITRELDVMGDKLSIYHNH
ncbi:bifunctional diaminohydroxyphosphoribosylaminopyrimidine deaminase/5-amino-6-(5-phosphoribosylamino)uracil reductase RibD [Mongoliitalea daihaiensis]|nr:bifunctional diaminohydroxyphosphoribosylaminopyrimidine deaminase/5-amino-6-(5-phosphoribosylamino)uracil reductase RibD [Mongoliitalea daihaiensis]